MLSLTISDAIRTAQLEKEIIPQWVLDALVGLNIGLYSPQNVMYLGFGLKEQQSITKANDALAVSPGGIIIALEKAGKTEAARWFNQKFLRRYTNPEADIILISKSCCE